MSDKQTYRLCVGLLGDVFAPFKDITSERWEYEVEPPRIRFYNVDERTEETVFMAGLLDGWSVEAVQKSESGGGAS